MGDERVIRGEVIVVKHSSTKQHSPQPALNQEIKNAGNSFSTHLQDLLKQKKYRQALEDIKKHQRSHPGVDFTPKESEVWYLRGQWEFQKQDFKQAEKSWERSIKLGFSGEVYYWRIRNLLELNQLDLALNLAKEAFITEKFPNGYNICYLKLLLLKGDTKTVEQLIQQQSDRFSTCEIAWIKGVIDLKNGQTQAALTAFEKIKQPITPGDCPLALIIYTQQLNENWDTNNSHNSNNNNSQNPILNRLQIYQQAKTGKIRDLDMGDFRLEDKASQEALMVLLICDQAKNEEYYNALKVALQFERRVKQFPELETLRPVLMALAGEEVLHEGDPECAAKIWQMFLKEQPFNPQLAVNLLEVLQTNDADQERQHLLNRFLQWLEQEGKKNPQVWPSERLKPVLAHLHCWLADTFISMDRFRGAVGEVQKAERILPSYPEVIARKGMIAVAEENYAEATTLLTQAIEQGSRYPGAYVGLLHCWEELENKPAYDEARRRFGKYFDDTELETEVETLPWIDALSTQNYALFSRLIQAEDPQDPPLCACRIFVDAVKGFPNSGGRVSLNQVQVAEKWDLLLQEIPEKPQIYVLQAIALCIHLFAKREKGIAALLNKYMQKLFLLSAAYPEAKIAHLVVQVVKENNPAKLEIPLLAYLRTMPQSGNALANIQLQARRFGMISSLIPTLEEALRREPQNPLLLLARATTYPVDHPSYTDLKQQGFELARRIQDAKALKAFREEQSFLSVMEAQKLIPDPDRFDQMNPFELESFLEQMIHKMLDGKLPKSEIDRMIPELKQKMLNNMPSFDDDEMDFNSLFDTMPNNSRKKKGRTRGGLQDLF